MSPTPRISNSAAVLGMGASCPIGYGIPSIQAAMAGGLRNFRDASMLGCDGKPARVSRLPDLAEWAPREARIAALAQYAVADLVADLSADLPADIPVYVGVAEEAPPSDLAAIRKSLALEWPALRPSPESPLAACRLGRIAFLAALAYAIRQFDEGKGELAVIVAADTRCTWASMDALYRERRLLNTRDDGTIPGEAAVAMLLASPRSTYARQHGLLSVVNPAFAADDPAALRLAPLATDGLGRSFNSLRQHAVAGAARPKLAIAFDTGELCFTRAFATGYLRSAELMPEPLRHELIAANLGDTGAAAAGMAIVRAAGLMHEPHGPGVSRALVYGHADSGKCAATMALRSWPEECT
jgi:hypothetical protein